jgi:hypothetical protein
LAANESNFTRVVPEEMHAIHHWLAKRSGAETIGCRMKIFLALTLGIAFAAPAALAAQRTSPRFEFQGAALGDTLLMNGVTEGNCRGSEARGELLCLKPTQSIGGEAVTPEYSYFNGRLYRVMLLFKPAAYGRLIDLFSAKYGAPDQVTSRPFRTIGGASDLNHEYVWKFREGSFTVTKYGSALDEGYAAISSAAATNAIARLKAEATKVVAERDLGIAPRVGGAGSSNSVEDDPRRDNAKFVGNRIDHHYMPVECRAAKDIPAFSRVYFKRDSNAVAAKYAKVTTGC